MILSRIFSIIPGWVLIPSRNSLPILLSSFLDGQISQCPMVWPNHVEIKSRQAHDLLLQCLHQAATCKNLIEEVLPLLKSTIQHYTLVALTQQTGKSLNSSID